VTRQRIHKYEIKKEERDNMNKSGHEGKNGEKKI
jgi:hypothetical protein